MEAFYKDSPTQEMEDKMRIDNESERCPNDKVQYRWWFEENNNVFLFFLFCPCGDNSQKCSDIRPYVGYFLFFSQISRISRLKIFTS